MLRFDESLRLELAHRYLSGSCGMRVLAKQYLVGRTALQSWINTLCHVWVGGGDVYCATGDRYSGQTSYLLGTAHLANFYRLNLLVF